MKIFSLTIVFTMLVTCFNLHLRQVSYSQDDGHSQAAIGPWPDSSFGAARSVYSYGLGVSQGATTMGVNQLGY